MNLKLRQHHLQLIKMRTGAKIKCSYRTSCEVSSPQDACAGFQQYFGLRGIVLTWDTFVKFMLYLWFLISGTRDSTSGSVRLLHPTTIRQVPFVEIPEISVEPLMGGSRT